MPALTTELVIFETSEAYRNDVNLPIAGFKVALRAKGVRAPVYYGKQLEEPGTSGYFFLNWDSYEAHEAFIGDPTYPAVIDGLKSSLAENGKSEVYHVQFSGPTIALDKPVTEIVILALKAPENRGAVEEILSKFSDGRKKELVFGRAHEDENKYVVISGWPSVEAHSEVTAKPNVAEALEKLYSPRG